MKIPYTVFGLGHGLVVIIQYDLLTCMIDVKLLKQKQATAPFCRQIART